MKKKLIAFAILSAFTLTVYNGVSQQVKEASGASEIQPSTQVGEPLKIGEITYQVNDVKKASKLLDGSGFNVVHPSSENATFAIVDFKIENNGKQQLFVNTELMELITEDGAIYEPVDVKMNGYLQGRTLNPGLTTSTKIAFEIPENLSHYNLQMYSDLLGTQSAVIELN